MILVQAKVAALLAPGPLVSLAEERDDREGFSDLPVRSVVRMLCLSGLGDLSSWVFFVVEGPYGGRDGGRVDIGMVGSVRMPLLPILLPTLLPTAGCSLELLVGYDGRRGNGGGLDNSLYVIAGIVPSPIHPLSGVLFPAGDDEDPVTLVSMPAEKDGSSSRDILSASSRSMLS